MPRFPNVITEKNSGFKIAFLAGMMYVGDTLYQVPETRSCYAFWPKNPKNGKLQTLWIWKFTGENQYTYGL